MTHPNNRLWIGFSLLIVVPLFAGVGGGIMRGDYAGFAAQLMEGPMQ